MRKIKITKQQTINPKAVYMGLSIAQIVIMCIGIGCALGTLGLLYFVLKLDINFTMTIVFIELVSAAGMSIIRINGMNLFKFIRVAFQAPIYRAYKSKGALDTYETETETKEK